MIDVLLRAVAVGVGVRVGMELVGNRPHHHPPVGWYSDPWREHTWRWWNGTWTGHTHN